MSNILDVLAQEQLRNDLTEFSIGDTIEVHERIKEGKRERVQVFMGTVIKKQKGGVAANFTVRKLSYGVFVEKTFLSNSPKIEKVEVKRLGKTRRAKLYYLRERSGKAAKVKEKMEF